MPSPIGPDYHIHIKLPGDPALTRDGSRLAFTLRWFEPDTLRPRSEIFVIEFGQPVLSGVSNSGPRNAEVGAGVSPRQLTFESDSEMPAWSPDGSAVAFLRPDERGVKQVWTMAAGGGEAVQVTYSILGVDALSWSPNGTRIAFRADVDQSIPDPTAPDPRAPQELQPMVTSRIRYKEDGAGMRGERFRHLFVVDLPSKQTWQITFGNGNEGAPAWSPDGKRIAAISDRNPFRDITSRTDLYVVPSDGGEADRRSGGLYMSGAVAWAPDSERLAVTGAETPQEVGGYGLICQGWVYVLELGSYPRRITDDTLRPASSATGQPVGVDYPAMKWLHDGRIVFLADSKGQSYICEVPASGEGSVRLVSRGGCQITAWAVSDGGGMAVMAAATPASPGELYLVDMQAGTEQRLTHFNDDYMAEHPPARLDKITVSQDGYEIECRLWLPPDFDPSRRYPLLLDVHGGPHSVFYDAFYPIHQIGATNGFVVIAPNPRGSSTYGLSFATAVQGDWGGGDYMDVMAAVREALKLPYVDESRVVIHGSSYGGYMASWAVGHTERFKAAVIAAPVTNLPSFCGTSDIGVNFSEVQFGGPRAEMLGWYLRHSPLTYATSVNTPVLLIHGEEDQRVPIEQTEQYFVALRRAGKTVEFVRLPKTSHGIFRAKHAAIRREYFKRMLDWFRRWLD